MKNHIITIFCFSFILLSSCSNDPKPTKSSDIKSEQPTINKTGLNEIEALFEKLNNGTLIINSTTKEELSAIYNIELNDYYMTKKEELEDHTLYITFTITNGKLSKISYATLSNTEKDFSYIYDLTKNQFGTNYSQTYNTVDSTDNNSVIIWKDSSINIQYESFSGLNSGYELIIK